MLTVCTLSSLTGQLDSNEEKHNRGLENLRTAHIAFLQVNSNSLSVYLAVDRIYFYKSVREFQFEMRFRI
jgi:hypothetical protein